MSYLPLFTVSTFLQIILHIYLLQVYFLYLREHSYNVCFKISLKTSTSKSSVVGICWLILLWKLITFSWFFVCWKFWIVSWTLWVLNCVDSASCYSYLENINVFVFVGNHLVTSDCVLSLASTGSGSKVRD